MVRDAPPVRTCVGCRSRAPSSELLRVVAGEHVKVEHGAELPGRDPTGTVVSVVPDPTRRRAGRGAHIHPNPHCLALAARRRAFGRALRITGIVDTRPLADYLDDLAKRNELAKLGELAMQSTDQARPDQRQQDQRQQDMAPQDQQQQDQQHDQTPQQDRTAAGSGYGGAPQTGENSEPMVGGPPTRTSKVGRPT